VLTLWADAHTRHIDTAELLASELTTNAARATAESHRSDESILRIG
jgi:hypothetical protein